MRWIVLLSAAAAALVALPPAALGWDPEATVLTADEILLEQTTIPGKRIPEALLADAQGVAIIPDVIKIGFVAAVRRGHGVVMVRDANGAWTLPQFITLTGGSLGWQAGIQGTDVVLVFTTKKSVEGLLRGKFTIGADASAAAGPVGRNASAATDARLKAEILSYSRSRGLFAGISLDGSAIEMDPVAQEMYYGAPPGQQPVRVPESAMKLVQDIVALTDTTRLAPPGTELQPAAATLNPIPMPVVANVRDQLANSANQLYGIVSQQWRTYLALPPEVFGGQNPPTLTSLQEALTRYDRIVQSPSYETLVSRAEFKNTYALLRDYIEQQTPVANPTLALPPPPLRQ
jgi:SH3 domain-containing YSC84-like protein 1